MTPQELVALFDVGIWGRAADRLAFLRWCVRRGLVAEGTPGGPMPDPRLSDDEEAQHTARAWTGPR